jgi:hypothetical protein
MWLSSTSDLADNYRQSGMLGIGEDPGCNRGSGLCFSGESSKDGEKMSVLSRLFSVKYP